MQGDAVHTYHWMTNAEFLNAVALGQVDARAGRRDDRRGRVRRAWAQGRDPRGRGRVHAVVLVHPARRQRFRRLRGNPHARAFLDGAGPAAIGAILGASVTLALALHQAWQAGVLAAAAVALLALRRGVVETLLCAGAVGVAVALAGGPLP